MSTSSPSCSLPPGGRTAERDLRRGGRTALPFETTRRPRVPRRRCTTSSRPELALAELARVTNPAAASSSTTSSRRRSARGVELDRFERVATRRTTERSSDGDLRDLFAMNGLMLVPSERFTPRRELDFYLGLAGCTGPEAERVKDLSPGDREHSSSRPAGTAASTGSAEPLDVSPRAVHATAAGDG